jgi:hypothetical protein
MVRSLSLMTTLFGLALAHEVTAQDKVDFDRDVRPILSNTCFTCHGPDSSKRQADLRFDVEASVFADRDGSPILVRGKPGESELLKRILTDDEDLVMPPPDQTQQLSKQDKEILKAWVEQGASWRGHWSFEPVRRPAELTVKNKAWPKNSIDFFVLKRLEEEGLSPSEIAAKHTLLRRISLDLTGLPPTIEELDAFLQDGSPKAYEKAVDRLLDSPRFGEHFALSWLDAARYADTNGYQQDRTRTLWPWRDWVIRALNSNMPFDQFTIEQIAGDHLENPTQDQLVATGFHRNHMLNGEGGRIAEESRVEYVIDRVETTGAVWLGLTIGCGRCHDHKYDPVSQREFYNLYSYFNSVDERGNVDAGGNANPVMSVPTKEQTVRKMELNAQVGDLQKELTAIQKKSQAGWEKELLAEITSGKEKEYWLTLEPGSLKSEQGQTLTVEDDGVTILASGKNPNTDTLFVTLKTDAKNVTALRLKAVPYEKFTNGGFARSDSGNFVLTEFRVDAKSTGEDAASQAKFASAQASFEQGGWPVKNAFDGKPNTGWAVHNPSNMRIPRQAMFVFEKPITGGEGTELRLELRHDSPHPFHNLSRFRVAITTEKSPKLDGSSGLPGQLIAAVKVDAAKRSAAQKKLISEEFRKRSPEVKVTQQKLDAAKKQIGEIEKRTVRTMVMRDLAKPRETFVLIRGTWNQPDKEKPCAPDTPGCLPPLPEGSPTNRLALARWLVDKGNPLTPRVVVNRYWQHFFGQGLVKTTEDFGSQGERPTHPLLLEWLAAEFVSSGWNVKHMLKLIVMSSTYKQSSKQTEELVARDSRNSMLARGARFRMTSHAIRDQALLLSGRLVEKIGGPPVKPYQPAGIWSDLSLGKISYQRDSGEALYRRSIYTFWRRGSAPTSLFDVASRQVCKVRVSRTNTPLHSLILFNETGFIEASRNFAERVMKAESEPAARLARAFRMATSRNPTAREAKVLLGLLTELQKDFSADAETASKYLTAGESKADASLEPTELAAFTAVTQLILNLDEVVTKE